MNKRNSLGIALLISFSIALAFNVGSASAISISPAKITMDFVPGFEQEFEGSIGNTGNEDAAFDVYTEGDLKDYLTLLTPAVINIPAQQSAVYRFKVKLPQSFDTPGRHEGLIWASEHVEMPEEGSGIVAVRLKVGAMIVVNVPYPGKYAEIGLEIKNPNVNKTVSFDVSVTNRGYENVTSARGEIELTNLENKTIAILRTKDKPIESTKTEVLHASWFSNVEAGIYKAKLSVFYDGEVAGLSRDFNLGAPLIRIYNVSAPPVTNGTIGKIYTQARSYWNQEIKDVYVELTVFDKKGGEVFKGKGQNVNMGEFTTVTFTNYWDTSGGIDLGDYKGVLMLHYLGKNDTAEINITVVQKPGLVIGADFLMIIILVIAVCAVIAIAAIFMMKRRGRKYNQKRLM